MNNSWSEWSCSVSWRHAVLVSWKAYPMTWLAMTCQARWAVSMSMRLLGDRNWYLPRWLQWLPAVHVEGAHVPEPAPEPAVA